VVSACLAPDAQPRVLHYYPNSSWGATLHDATVGAACVKVASLTLPEILAGEPLAMIYCNAEGAEYNWSVNCATIKFAWPFWCFVFIPSMATRSNYALTCSNSATQVNKPIATSLVSSVISARSPRDLAQSWSEIAVNWISVRVRPGRAGSDRQKTCCAHKTTPAGLWDSRQRPRRF
jgi:hypothetical protein